MQVVDRLTMLIPERKGNQFALGRGNIVADARVGLTFFLDDDPAMCAQLSADGRPATLVIRVHIEVVPVFWTGG